MSWSLSSDPPEHQHPLVAEIERLPGAGRAPGDHHRRQDRLLELVGLDLGVKVLVFLMERDESLVLLGVLGQLVEILELLGLARLGGRFLRHVNSPGQAARPPLPGFATRHPGRPAAERFPGRPESPRTEALATVASSLLFSSLCDSSRLAIGSMQGMPEFAEMLLLAHFPHVAFSSNSKAQTRVVRILSFSSWMRRKADLVTSWAALAMLQSHSSQWKLATIPAPIPSADPTGEISMSPG